MAGTRAVPRSPEDFAEPRWARVLFRDTRASWLWLAVRFYLGVQWLDAGLSKLGNPAWTGNDAGTAVAGFANGAISQTAGAHPQVHGWYAWFLESVVIPNSAAFAFLVTAGEILVGAALILGAFTGIAAFVGLLMNANYLLAGAVSSNPEMILFAVLIMLAWRNAGWIGLDRWLLPALGTPWQPGEVFTRGRAPAERAMPDTLLGDQARSGTQMSTRL